MRGFYLLIKQPPHSPPIKLPSIFKDVQVRRNCISFTSNDLIKLNNRINKAVEEIYLQSDQTISKLLNDIRTQISCMYNLIEMVANLDLVYSFAYQSCCFNYVRPNFGNFMDVKNVSTECKDVG